MHALVAEGGFAVRVLLVEDDESIGDAVRDHVAADGHAVDWVRSLAEATRHVRAIDYDQLLLDLSLPDGDGLALLATLGRASRGARVPDGRRCRVVILTARDRLSERVGGLDAGADDYLVKPFDLEELTARMRALERRHDVAPERVLVAGSVSIDAGARRVLRRGEPVSLSAREWGLVERLARRPGATVSRGELDGALYDLARDIEPNALDALVSRTRKKLGREAIVTVRGLGYRLGTVGPPS